MTNQTFLFIGGLRDGERLPVPEQGGRLPASVELPMPGKRTKGTRGPLPSEIYERIQIHGETVSFDIFRLKGVSGNSVMRALVDCYQSKEAAE